MHRIGLSHEDMRCDLVFGAAEFPERREQNQIIERLFRQGQSQGLGFRAVFRSSHCVSAVTWSRGKGRANVIEYATEPG
jgi:hypothetical protein